MKKAVSLAREENFDAIWVSCPPNFLIPAAVRMKRRSGKPVLLDMRDPWCHNFTFKYTGLRRRLAKRYEAQAVRELDAIVCVTPGDGEIMRDRYAAQADKIACIVNGFDKRDIPSSVPRNDGKFVVALMGQSYEDPTPLFDGIEKARTKNPEFAEKFIFRWVGFNGKSPDCGEYLQLYPRCSHDEALGLIADADAFWLEVPLTKNSGYVVCSKTYEYLALKRPIIGTSPLRSCNRELLQGICRSRFIESRSSDDIAELLLWAFDEFKAGRLTADIDAGAIIEMEAVSLVNKFEEILLDIITEKA